LGWIEDFCIKIMLTKLKFISLGIYWAILNMLEPTTKLQTTDLISSSSKLIYQTYVLNELKICQFWCLTRRLIILKMDQLAVHLIEIFMEFSTMLKFFRFYRLSFVHILRHIHELRGNQVVLLIKMWFKIRKPSENIHSAN